MTSINSPESSYLQAKMAAEKWTAQSIFSRNTMVAGLVILVCLLLDLGKVYQLKNPATLHTV